MFILIAITKKMKKVSLNFIFGFLSTALFTNLQAQTFENNTESFWNRLQFGGGMGMNFGSNFTNISLSPSAIYPFNQYIATGIVLNGQYVQHKNFSSVKQQESWIYGGGLVLLGNPLDELQLSAELEQLRVNTTATFLDNTTTERNYWNTGLFLGAGYRAGNATIGVRYNVLKDKNNIYGEAWMPFVRVYF